MEGCGRHSPYGAREKHGRGGGERRRGCCVAVQMWCRGVWLACAACARVMHARFWFKSCAWGPARHKRSARGAHVDDLSTVVGSSSAPATNLSMFESTNRKSKHRELSGKIQLRLENLLKTPLTQEATCRTRGEDCGRLRVSPPLLLHMRSAKGVCSGSGAIQGPVCSYLAQPTARM